MNSLFLNTIFIFLATFFYNKAQAQNSVLCDHNKLVNTVILKSLDYGDVLEASFQEKNTAISEKLRQEAVGLKNSISILINESKNCQ